MVDGIHHGVHDRVEYDHRQGVPLVNLSLQSNQRCGPVGRGECYREIGVERSDKVKKLGGEHGSVGGQKKSENGAHCHMHWLDLANTPRETCSWSWHR